MKKYESLSFSDDFMFCKILENDLELARKLVEVILSIRVKKVSLLETQKSLQFTPYDRGVRLDVFLEDDENTIYNIEMQTTNQKDIAKRSRYYQGMIDLNTIEKGATYSELKKTYVIFICKEKLTQFQGNLPVYTFEKRCLEDPNMPLNDGTTAVFLNAAGNLNAVGEDLRAFLQYVSKQECSDDLTRDLQKQVVEAKTSLKWRIEYMSIQEKIEEAKAEGRAEGRAEVVKELVLSAAADGRSAEEIAAFNHLSEDDVRKILEANKS